MVSNKVKIGILCMSILSMSGLVITSAFSAIIAAFPGEPISKIQMIATIPSLGALITTLFIGVLATKIPKKILALLGIFAVGLGGLLPIVFHESINALLVCSLIMGIGLGFIATINPMLLSINFEGEERASLMGKGTAVTSLGAIILMMGGGFLGSQNWSNTYYIFLITILIFFLVMLFLPLDKIEKDFTAEHGGKKMNLMQTMGNLNKYVFLISILAFVMSFIYTVYPTNLSIVVSGKGIGGTSMTGIINAVGTVGGFLAGMNLKYINRAVKDKILGIGFLFLASTFILVLLFDSVFIMLLGAILSGLAMVMIMSTIPYYVSVVVRPFELAIAMSIFTFMNSLGGIISPMVLSWLGISFGNQAFLFAGIASAVIGVVCLAAQLGKRVFANSYQANQTNEAVLTKTEADNFA